MKLLENLGDRIERECFDSFVIYVYLYIHVRDSWAGCVGKGEGR